MRSHRFPPGLDSLEHMRTTITSPTPSCRPAARWLPWAIPAVLVVSWVVHVLRNYQIRAFSDPLNWLTFARNFALEIQTSKFAVGFPIFLRAALELLGPFHVFLVNLPVLLALYLLAAALVFRTFQAGAGIPRWQMVSVTLALFLSYDRWLVVQMMNPFRDPLSFLLALGAAGLLIRHVSTGGLRPAGAMAAGLLLGLASSVRETSVLLLAPFVLFAFWSWRADPRVRFWRDSLLFAAGLAVGLAPLLAQSKLSTGQALLPPQSVADQMVVPGVHFNWNCLRGTWKAAGPYFLRTAGWPGLLLLAWSTVLAVKQRNRIVAGLLLPAALVHLVFYSFYWTFVPRYFYAAAVFAIPAMAWGLLATIQPLATRLPSRIRTVVPTLLVAGLALFTAQRLLANRSETPLFQIPQARRFAADWNPLLPADAIVFSRRHLCEMLQWFTEVRAWPVTALIPNDVPAEAALREALAPYLADSRPLYLFEMHIGPSWEVDAALVDRICGLDFIHSFPAARYNLNKLTGARELRLFRVRRFQPDPALLPGVEEARTGTARFDFSLSAVPIALPLLSGDFDLPNLKRLAPRILNVATVTLPGPIRKGETALAELRLRCARRDPGTMTIEVRIGNITHRLNLENNRIWQVFMLAIPGPLETPEMKFQASAPFELHWVDWSIPRPVSHLNIDVGAEGDTFHLREGWFQREQSSGITARWTGPVASLAWLCSSPRASGQITLRHFEQNRPVQMPLPRIWCNSVELQVASAPDAAPGFSLLSAHIPPDILNTDNIIRIESDTWQPGGKDTRNLGIYVDWVRLETETP